MEPITKIRVVSRRQAMDWSLVLVSQGIESSIQTLPDESEWWIEVPAGQSQQAFEVIKKYHVENRRWMWRRETAFKGVLFDWAALSWVVLVTVFFWAASEVPDIKAAGVMDSEAVGRGEWWRVCTAVWLHADAGHLAGNASLGILLLGLTLGIYGSGIGMLAAYVAGIGGNLLAWIVATGPRLSLGASGLVMGCIGLLAAHTLFSRDPMRFKVFATSLAAALMLFVLVGLSPGTDVLAHAGGALSGLAVGAILALARTRPESPRLNLVCGILYFMLILIPWALALI